MYDKRRAGIQIIFRQDCYNDKTIIYGKAKLYTISDLEKIVDAVKEPIIFSGDEIEIYNDYRE